MMHRALRLTNSRAALVANYRQVATAAGVRCGAAVKADAYGLGAKQALAELYSAGCRDFFVSTWYEASELGLVPDDASVSVLHGPGPSDMEQALQSRAVPVLNSATQVQRWKEAAPGRPCDVMVDTGMNRLGLRPEEASVLKGLRIRTLHSHLACADDHHIMNERQLAAFSSASAEIRAERYSLANSAGVFLGRSYAFDLVRPGLALYGGIPRPEASGLLKQVAHLEAQVVQRRRIKVGESCGYGAAFVAQQVVEAAIVNIGYADGYWRAFSMKGSASFSGVNLPVLGRVSMDLVALNCNASPNLAEGDWVALEFELERAAALTGMSQYELLTGLGQRFERVWK